MAIAPKQVVGFEQVRQAIALYFFLGTDGRGEATGGIESGGDGFSPWNDYNVTFAVSPLVAID